MSSATSQPLQEWLVIIPDHTGALAKRLSVRPKHLEGIMKDREDMWLLGGMCISYFVALDSSGWDFWIAVSEFEFDKTFVACLLEMEIANARTQVPR